MEDKSIPKSHSSSGLFEIIRDSIKTTSRNRKQLIPILLYVFISVSLLEFAQHNIQAYLEKEYHEFHLAEQPNVLGDFGRKLDLITYRGALDDVLEIVLVRFFTRVFSYIPTLIFFVTTVSSSYEAHTGNVLEPTKCFSNVRNWYKEPLITSFCILLITLGIICLYSISYGIINILAEDSWSILFFVAITLSVPICYFYMATLWMVSLVVSVLEEDIGGFKAIGRAEELMNGKRLQALLMMVPFVIASVIVYRLAYGLKSYDLSRATRLAIGISLINGSDCFLELFMFVVYTVFYHERRTSLEKKELKGLYIPVTAGEAY